MEVANKCIQWVKITLRKPFPFLDPPPPPPELAASEDSNPKPSPPQAQQLDWSIPLTSYCLGSATSNALLFRQIHGKTPPSMHFFFLALVIAFSSVMVAKFISPKFPYAAKMLELAAIFWVATGFYLCITLFLPLSLKIVSWFIYCFSLIVIIVCS
ncbi:proline-rich protein 36-like [Forsythia ovata]|uniref:Proline-rich protein 36-like n=1 Tax=Forsythia ovata TaxID=205694 RepID=A0ABD1U867_9LAMI